MYELAKRIVCSIIAVALSTTVTIVEGLLPLNPQWLERVAHVAAQLRAAGRGEVLSPHDETYDYAEDYDAEYRSEAGDADPVHEDLQRILSAYQQLWDFVQTVKAKGLALDDDFIDMVEREWSVSTLLSYLRSADQTLQDSAGKAQMEAARYLIPQGPHGGGSG